MEEELSKYNKNLVEAYRRGYRITKDGRTLNPSGKEITGAISVNPRKHKARKHNIRIDGNHAAFKAHRLQAYQKFGDAIFEEGMMIRHLNDNPLDNSWDNIAIGTASDNLIDSYKNGSRNRAPAIESIGVVFLCLQCGTDYDHIRIPPCNCDTE